MNLFRACLILAAIVSFAPFGQPVAEASGVGYITILNGQWPSEAFTLERNSVLIQPVSVYTDLNEGDIITPLPNSELCFTSRHPISTCTPINGRFVAEKKGNRSSDNSFQILDYDLSAREFKARPLRPVKTYGRKGDINEIPFTLPPQTVNLFTDSIVFRSLFEKMPFVKFVSSPKAADRLVGQNGDIIKLAGPGGLKKFHVPTQAHALQQEILKSLAQKTLSNQGNVSLAPDFRWSVRVHAPASFGNIVLKDQKWIIEKELEVDGPATIPVSAGPRLLTFSFDNRSRENYFIYLISLDGHGNFDLADLNDQVRPLPAGQRRHDSSFYEPRSDNEQLWLIISEYPLDLRLFEPEAGGEQEPLKVTFNPVPEGSWKSIMLNIQRK